MYCSPSGWPSKRAGPTTRWTRQPWDGVSFFHFRFLWKYLLIYLENQFDVTCYAFSSSWEITLNINRSRLCPVLFFLFEDNFRFQFSFEIRCGMGTQHWQDGSGQLAGVIFPILLSDYYFGNIMYNVTCQLSMDNWLVQYLWNFCLMIIFIEIHAK